MTISAAIIVHKWIEHHGLEIDQQAIADLISEMDVAFDMLSAEAKKPRIWQTIDQMSAPYEPIHY